jgi:gliding motility-associated-like protein
LGIINPRLTLGQGANPNEYLIKRKTNSADSTDFRDALKKTQLGFKSSQQADTLVITIVAVTKSGCEITRTTTFYNYKKPNFPKDTIVKYICSNGDPVDLKSLNKKYTALPGDWSPLTASKNTIFDPKKDKNANFYFISKKIGNCPTDSMVLQMKIQNVPSTVLPRYQVICKDSTIILDVSKFDFDQNIWQNSVNSKQFSVNQEGKYYVELEKNGCFARDSIKITTKNCNICDFYVPNSFSPNDDGFNDYLEVFSECSRVEVFQFAVYDKWGNHIFESNNLGENWDGKYKDIPANSGVYTYYLKTTTDFDGKPLVQIKKGDFTLIR